MKCPRCGSSDNAEILYGLPVFDDKAEDDIKNKKIVLGGCIVMPNRAKYQCNKCRFKFGSDPVYLRNDSFMDYRKTIKSFRYSEGCFFSGRQEFVIENYGNTATLTVSPPIISEKSPVVKTISLDEFYIFLDIIYSKFLLHEWKKSYYNKNVLDGFQWDINIVLENESRIDYYGSNMYPAYWKEFIATINEYSNFSGIVFSRK